ncbi:MAG: 30S ribosomal protein S3 [Desulfurococcales archaeon]|nr:30S ribosomal protein S3 [Desulfurococcales archaeon]MCE4622135.1 30S ribosomal protein S3 [Desulfurococcales archaeon]MCE4629342.1 30S ribosomal protein S3 [Desulfurococcales archaeon]NOZ30587.1 30S ribosomal protein S3 [Thermoproteota archaeon]
MVTRTHRVFLQQGLIRARVDEYLAQNFYEAGYSGVIVTQSGLGTRIHIYAERPALIIGRRGSTIRRLHNIFQTVFGFEGVQITVSEPENPELDARVQAFRIARNIERGFHFRRVAFAALRRIMANGAIGVEITISGKLTSERARFEKYTVGKVYKSGHNVDVLVDRAVAHAKLPKGVIGVKVVIARPGKPADYIRIKEEEEVRDLLLQLRGEEEEGELPSELEELIEEVEEGGEA